VHATNIVMLMSDLCTCIVLLLYYFLFIVYNYFIHNLAENKLVYVNVYYVGW